MNDVAVCLFAWDFCDEGVDPLLERLAELGATSIFLASVYHAGWFLLPHNPKRKCHFCEDGAAYFHPDASLYENTPLKPRIAEIAARTDWFEKVSRRLDTYGLRMTAWTVCNHNTPLGLAHPRHTVRNAFGDSYPHALTPASEAVRRYIRALAVDLAGRYRLRSVFLEAPNYRGRKHGHHHERELVALGDLENALFDVSFSEHDMAAACAAGVDAEHVRRRIRDHLHRYLGAAPDRPSDLPRTMEQFVERCPALVDYLAVLDARVTSLVTEIKDDLRPLDVELEGVEPIAAYDTRVVGAYGRTPQEIARLTSEAKSKAAPHQRIRVGFRLGGDPPGQKPAIGNPEKARQCVRAAEENGADSIFFYNYSESPLVCLSWIRHAVSG